MTDYGKLPPQAIDLEEAILGQLMIDGEAFDNAGDLLKEEIFYKPNSQKIFAAIKELSEKNEPIDMLTTTNKLKEHGNLDTIGGPIEISRLTARIGGAGNISTHVKIIYEKYLKRELIRVGSEMVNDGFEDSTDVFDTYDRTLQTLEKLITFTTTNFTPKERLAEARESIYKAHGSKTGLSGVSTGYDSMDKFTGGMQPGDLIVAGGWPGTFKSALVLAIQHNAERSGIPTMMFEQEMSGRQVGMREIAMDTKISIEQLKTGNVTESQLGEIEQAIGRIEKRKVFIDLTSGIKIGKIKSILRKLKKDENIGLAVIDYLGLCDLEVKKYGGQEPAIDNFCRELKVTAKELDIPIILLAQFTKDSGNEKLKPPHAGLLKGSGAIEAHSDCVWLLWNPSALDEHFQYDMGDGRGLSSCFGKIGILHAKNRQGRVGMQWLNVNASTHIFGDPEKPF